MQHPGRLTVKEYVGVGALIVLIGASASPVRVTASAGCQNVNGRALWTLIPSPNDPFGRTLGPTSGHLKGSATTLLTSVAAGPGGGLSATSSDTWVLDAQDMLQFTGTATFTPIPNEPIDTVSDERTLTVIGGSGAYAGATGTLNVSGFGYNLLGPNAGAGNTFFDVRFSGTICKPN